MASNFDLADRVLDGKLAEHLREQRDAGATLDEMAQHFAAMGVKVSRETLRRWCERLGIPKTPAPERAAS